jgi:Zn-dependent protease with chaperone function
VKWLRISFTGIVADWMARPWVARVALLALYVCLSVNYLITDGLEDLQSDIPDFLFDVAIHVVVARILTVSLLLLANGGAAIWRTRRHAQALRALRLAPSAALAAASAGIVPASRVCLLADARPFAVCVGLWRPVIYVSSGLVEGVSLAALRAAVAHEEAHRRQRDPARHLALRILAGAVASVPWLAILSRRVALRAEIRADRFARASASTSALAEALAAVIRGGALLPAPPMPAPSAAMGWTGIVHTNLSGADVDDLATWSDEAFGLRLRYLRLPDDATLPPLLPAELRLATAIPPLARALPYGVTGRRWSPFTCAVACLLTIAEVAGPLPDGLMDLLP